MKFYVDPADLELIEYPCFILAYNDWDDFSYRTSFRLSFHNDISHETTIGRVKIMNRNENRTINVIPKVFDELLEDFCSLGQDITYYENLKKVYPDQYEDILDVLNDAAFFPEVTDNFENDSKFINSLLRNSEAEKALKEAKFLIEGISYETAFQFKYSCLLPNADRNHEADLNFGDTSNLPNRIIALVGKNGTGKTQFLAKLAYDLSGKSKSKNFKLSFSPHRPYFSKIIAVSFSAFDKFSKPQKDKSFSYEYCGIKDESGRILSIGKTIENIKKSIEKIKWLDRSEDWVKAFNEILGEGVTSTLYNYFFNTSSVNLFEENEEEEN